MQFDIGPGTNNATLVHEMSDAAYKQSPSEHEELLNRYVKPGMSPAQLLLAQLQGEQLEKLYKKYWLEETPRYEFSPSSSWIRRVENLGDLGLTGITTDRGRTYWVPQSSEEAGDFVTSPSLGSYWRDFLARRK